MTTFFTSDTHFAHANIIQYCGRPFRDVEEMNAVMVERWNARVKPGDIVYHLGDFAFGPVENIGKFLGMLNGQVHLVLGNHDRQAMRMAKFGFAGVYANLLINVEDVVLLLIHKPGTAPTKTMELRADGGMADYHLHGHVHEKYARRGNAINVGVDVRGFQPVTLEELLA